MKLTDFYDYKSLRSQLDLQKKHAWSIDEDFDWNMKIDTSRFFLPLDQDAVAFPGATPEQQVVLSQLMGLIVNATISEMEDVANKIRDTAWRKVLDDFPVNPEMKHLGEEFFQEEAKHAEMFRRFNDCFCMQLGIESHDLQAILPSAYGALFQKSVRLNAEAGGHAFWWIVAIVEEVSVHLYQNIYKHRHQIDPFYFHIQRKHFEEESRHTNYAFLMLELIKAKNSTLKQKLHQKFDLLYSELFATGWVLTELHKVFRARDLAHKHEWFARIAECLPLLEKLSPLELGRRLFVSAPYVSLILNHNHHKYSKASAESHGALRFFYPKPKPADINTATAKKSEASPESAPIDPTSLEDGWKLN